uniref:Uncharacterized protein n=1 Tax=Romanomermis culicivorax TaxID=13658 RepID=A0A915L632_ROMCU
MTDWVTAVRKPPQHRVNKDGSPSMNADDCYMVRKHTFYCIAILFLSFLLMIFYLPNERFCRKMDNKRQYSDYFYTDDERTDYNETYPLSKPQITISEDGVKIVNYRVAIITDLDQMSKVDGAEFMWRSFMRKGYLRVDQRSGTFSVSWDSE